MAAEETQAVENEAPQKSGGSLMGKLAVVGFMGVVILVECVLANMFIPSADDIAAAAEARRLSLEQAEKEENGESGEFTEVELGDYAITSKQAGENLALRVDFKLFGTVSNSDEAEFKDLYERNQNRFRSRILVVIRNANLEELQEAQLGLIKRRILEKSHALFGKPLLRTVGFSEFSTMEQ